MTPPNPVAAGPDSAPATGPPSAPATGPPSAGVGLYQQGLRALENQERQAALDFFQQAWQYEAELDPATRGELRDKLPWLRMA